MESDWRGKRVGRIQFLLWGVESKAMLGFLWCSVAQSKKGRGIWDSGSARTVFGPVKEMLSESVERCGGWERENRLLCRHQSRFSTRKAGRKDRQREGSIQSRWW